MSEHKNKTITKQDRGIVLLNEPTALIENCVIQGCRVGIDARSCGTVDIRGTQVEGGGHADQKYAYGVRLGYSGKPEEANKLVRIEGCTFSDFGAPSGDYANYNRDHIASEVGNTLWVKNSRFVKATDACIDAKGTLVLKDCEFISAHRLIRIWNNTKVVAVNCRFTSAPGHEIFWFYDKSASLALKDCTFDGETVLPVGKIGFDNLTQAEALKLVSYSVPTLDPWFNTLPPSQGKKVKVDIPALKVTGLEVVIRE